MVQRELREGARRPVNHRLRFGSAGVGTLLLWIIVANSDEPANQLGGWLLGGLHSLTLGLIFMIVPALTADCMAREKREGTLGLLFLTPLSAGGIVAGKALAQGLRAFTLWLAVLPILIIPFVAGGVTWFDALTAVSLEFCATVLCLAAGLLASSLARERNTAFLLAFIFGAIFLFLFSQLFEVFFFVGWVRTTPSLSGMMMHWWEFSQETMLIFSGLLEFRAGFAGWDVLTTLSVALARIWMRLCLAGPPFVLLVFYVVARFSAWRVERSWQDKVPSARRESLLRRYCTPLFRRRYRRKMQRTLDWNPIAWLQQYSWKARLGKWGLCLAFLLIECAARSAGEDALDRINVVLLLTLAGIYTFASVSGFLEEKRSGALELLLVTPISANKLIFGRVWGLWTQFLPAGLVRVGFYLHDVWSCGYLGSVVTVEFILACGFFALPVFATYFALRVRNLIVAAVLTWIALLLPFFFVLFSCQRFLLDPTNMSLMPAMFFSYGAFALLACSLLRHSLSRRIYSF